MQEKGSADFSRFSRATLRLKRHLVAEEHVDFNGVWKGLLAVYPGSRLGKHTPHSLYQTKLLDVKLFNQAL